MGVKSERVTILTSPEFKAFLGTEAGKEGVSVSELIRVRCEQAPANDTEDELLSQLTHELREATDRATRSLDQGLKKAESVLRQINKRKTKNA